MAGAYRPTRNIIKSCIEAVRNILANASYTNVTVVKSFKQASNTGLNSEEKNAIICVRVKDTIHEGAEVGSNLTKRKPFILIDLFCTSDGQREDLKDLLITNLKTGINYYEYTVTGGVTSDATYESGETANGKIIIDRIDDTPLNIETDKAQLELIDRYRHLITLHCSKTALEE